MCNDLSVVGDGSVVVGGGFDLPDVYWLDHDPLTVRSFGVYSALINLINDYGLKQFRQEPTRICGSRSSILDLLFSNRDPTISFATAIPGLSDHKVT